MADERLYLLIDETTASIVEATKLTSVVTNVSVYPSNFLSGFLYFARSIAKTTRSTFGATLPSVKGHTLSTLNLYSVVEFMFAIRSCAGLFVIPTFMLSVVVRRYTLPDFSGS